MPKGIFKRPPARLIHHVAAGESDVRIPAPLEAACQNFETEAGGRDALVEHLTHAKLTFDQELLVGAIADPRNDKASLARICYTYDIQFADLVQLFRSAGFARAQVGAMRRIWSALPEVAGDVMGRSVPHYLQCRGCFGKGEVTVPVLDAAGVPTVETQKKPCTTCDGEGEVLVQPKLDTQKVALELGGLIQSKGVPVQVNVTQQQAQGMGGGALGGFYQDSDAVVFPQDAKEAGGEPEPEPQEPEPPVDAEVVGEFSEAVGEPEGEEA